MSDCRKIAINGYVTIKNGDKMVVDRGKNAIVRQGMRHILGCMVCNSLYAASAWNGHSWFYGSTNAAYIRFGKSNIPTTQLMDALTSTINLAPTSFSNIGGVSTRNSGKCVYTTFVATWSAGALNPYLQTGQVLGELGVFFGLFDKFLATQYIENASNTTVNKAEILFSRFSLGDAAFIPDSTKPVVVEWEFEWEFV